MTTKFKAKGGLLYGQRNKDRLQSSNPTVGYRHACALPVTRNPKIFRE